MIESIPCRHCGNYFSHKNGCPYWATTGMSDAIIMLEIKQRAMDDHYKLESRIKYLEAKNRELRNMLYDFSDIAKEDLDRILMEEE